MKLVMTLLVRDEADIVAANLDYHFAQGIDFVIATDHSSRDCTAELLRGYERDGVLLLREVGGDAHDQATHVNSMARAAAIDHGADWVINNDADEFWWPLVGRLKDVLGAVPGEFGALVAPRFNFLPREGGSGPFLERMVVRETASKNGRGDPLEPKVIHRATPEIEMAPGNHSIDAPDLTVAPDVGLLEVLHFPVRTFEQFERKVLNVGIGYERLERAGRRSGAINSRCSSCSARTACGRTSIASWSMTQTSMRPLRVVASFSTRGCGTTRRHWTTPTAPGSRRLTRPGPGSWPPAPSGSRPSLRAAVRISMRPALTVSVRSGGWSRPMRLSAQCGPAG